MAALAYGGALGRLPRIRLFSGILVGAAAALVVERVLIETGHPASVALAWLTVYAVGAIAVTIVWTMAASVFDARQAKRLFPLVHRRRDRGQLRRHAAVRAGRPRARHAVAPGPRGRSC